MEGQQAMAAPARDGQKPTGLDRLVPLLHTGRIYCDVLAAARCGGNPGAGHVSQEDFSDGGRGNVFGGSTPFQTAPFPGSCY